MRPMWLVVILLFQLAKSAKIGVFTAPFSNSQMVFTIRIAESLADDGHDVVIVKPEFNPTANSIKSSNPKIREIFVKAAPIESWENYNSMKHRENFENWSFFDYDQLGKAITKLVGDACQALLANDNFLRQIKEENFDLVFNHHLDFCLHGVAYAAGVKKWVTSMPLPLFSGHLEDLGIPYFNSFLPGLIQNATMEMTLHERTKSVLSDFFLGFVGRRIAETPADKLFKEKFGKDFIDVSELRKKAILSFVNADPFLEYPIPVTHKIQYIGGLGTKDPKPLKEPFLSFAEKATNLVIVSFGSVVKAADMPLTWKNAFLDLFKKNPEISFVWKFEEDIEVPKNVLKTKWFPQNDILALNKTVAFITHGGYNSLGEAIQSGTPCIFVPLATEQCRNSMLGQYRGIGLQLPKTDLTGNNLHAKLQEILTNPNYKENAKKYQILANNRLNSPDQVLRYWTRMALQHDLDLALPNLNFVKLYNIDIYLLLGAIILVLLLIISAIIRFFFRIFCQRKTSVKQKIH